jgi:pimeloyl-ACP methyl ester carboxylesterase
MLALAYACSHPENARALVLIGCGTFDAESRARMKELIGERGTEKAYDFCPAHADREDSWMENFDIRAHTKTWEDMMRLQENGTYPESFSRITAPALMVHGSYDPHPGRMIYDSLTPYIKNLQYRELEKCGHYPWREKFARDRFFAIMIEWMKDHAG